MQGYVLLLPLEERGWGSRQGKDRDAAAAKGWLNTRSTEQNSEKVGHR